MEEDQASQFYSKKYIWKTGCVWVASQTTWLIWLVEVSLESTRAAEAPGSGTANEKISNICPNYWGKNFPNFPRRSKSRRGVKWRLHELNSSCNENVHRLFLLQNWINFFNIYSYCDTTYNECDILVASTSYGIEEFLLSEFPSAIIIVGLGSVMAIHICRLKIVCIACNTSTVSFTNIDLSVADVQVSNMCTLPFNANT